MKNLILCGMAGVGKTYIGEKLAKHLGWTFLDVDQLIEKRSGLTCREIVLTKGEAAFRELEKEEVMSLNCTSAVIATGGGILKDNIKHLKKCGKLVYLKNNLDLLYKRLIAKKPLPSFIDPHRPEGSFKELFLQREPLYEQCDITLDLSSMGEEEIIAKLAHFKNRPWSPLSF